MDFSLIIFFIIASIVGSILKENKKRAGTGKGRIIKPNGKVDNYSYPKYNPPWENELLNKKRGIPALNQQVNNMGSIIDKEIESVDIQNSQEGKRQDIGMTYEGPETPFSGVEGSSWEGKSLENEEVQHSSYEDNNYISQQVGVIREDIIETIEAVQNFKLRFDNENIINAIIMSEVLSPPKCRR